MARAGAKEASVARGRASCSTQAKEDKMRKEELDKDMLTMTHDPDDVESRPQAEDAQGDDARLCKQMCVVMVEPNGTKTFIPMPGLQFLLTDSPAASQTGRSYYVGIPDSAPSSGTGRAGATALRAATAARSAAKFNPTPVAASISEASELLPTTIARPSSSLQQRRQSRPARKIPSHRPTPRRSRSQVQVPHSSTVKHNGDDTDGSAEEEQETVTIEEPCYMFQIGDVEAVKAFYYARCKELTMKPLRQIVTDWVKLLAPKRLNNYGPYHKKFPSEMPFDAQPPWWPVHVPYNEPSHLKLRYLIPLAVDIMLIHRQIDEECGKRKMSWMAELHKRAHFCVETTSTDTFTSSKGGNFNEVMKRRALDVILPNLFDIGQSHEDYIIQNGLFEGSGKQDPRTGKQVTWQDIPRPDRTKAAPKRKRVTGSSVIRPVRKVRKHRQEPDASDHDTEIDEEMYTQSSACSSFQSMVNRSDTPKAISIRITASMSPKTSTPQLLTDTQGPKPVSQQTEPLHMEFLPPMGPPLAGSASRLSFHDISDPEAKLHDETQTSYANSPHHLYSLSGYHNFHGLPDHSMNNVSYMNDTGLGSPYYTPPHQGMQIDSLSAGYPTLNHYTQTTQGVYGNIEMHGLHGFPYESGQATYTAIAPEATLLAPDNMKPPPSHGVNK